MIFRYWTNLASQFFPFDSWIVLHWMNISHFAHLFICWKKSGLFPVLAIMNNTNINILVKVFVWTLAFTSLLCMRAKSLQLCLTVYNRMNGSMSGSSVHGILQARMLERVAMPSCRGSSWPRDWTSISYVSSTGRRVFSLPVSCFPLTDHYWFQIWPMYMLISTICSYYVPGCLGRKGYKWRKEMGPDLKYVVIL